MSWCSLKSLKEISFFWRPWFSPSDEEVELHPSSEVPGSRANWFQEKSSGSSHNLRAVTNEEGTGEAITHQGWKSVAWGPSEEQGACEVSGRWKVLCYPGPRIQDSGFNGSVFCMTH